LLRKLLSVGASATIRRPYLQFIQVFNEISEALLKCNIIGGCLGDNGSAHPHGFLLVRENLKSHFGLNALSPYSESRRGALTYLGLLDRVEGVNLVKLAILISNQAKIHSRKHTDWREHTRRKKKGALFA